MAIEGCLIVDKKMIYVDLFLVGLFQDFTWCDYVIGGGDKVQSVFTQYARRNPICGREKAFTPLVGAYRMVPIFQDRMEDGEVPVVGRTFL